MLALGRLTILSRRRARTGCYVVGPEYIPFQFPPTAFGSNSQSFLVPHLVTGIVQYKHDKLSIAPSLQVFAGIPYGVPTEVLGYNPGTCTANSLAIPSAVAAGRGSDADYTSCGGILAIPNPETGHFDRSGEFTEPTQLVVHLNVGYDVTPRTHLSLTLANLVSTCFGGTKAAWTTAGSGVCQYGLNPNNPIPYYSNFWNGASPSDLAANGGTPIAGLNDHSYNPFLFRQPFAAFLSASFKL